MGICDRLLCDRVRPGLPFYNSIIGAKVGTKRPPDLNWQGAGWERPRWPGWWSFGLVVRVAVCAVAPVHDSVENSVVRLS